MSERSYHGNVYERLWCSVVEKNETNRIHVNMSIRQILYPSGYKIQEL